MNASDGQSSQLEAILRRMLTDENLVSGFLSKDQKNLLAQQRPRAASKARVTKQKGKNTPARAYKASNNARKPPQQPRGIFPATSSLRATIPSSGSEQEDQSSHPSHPRVESISKKVLRFQSDIPQKRTTTQRPSSHEQTSSTSQHLANLNSFGAEGSGEVKRFVVGLDYGTTFTSVSCYAHDVDDEHPRAFPNEIKSIINWSEDGMAGMRRQLPTESWYPKRWRRRPGDLRNDGSTSAGPSATTQPQSNGNVDPMLDGNNSNTYMWGYEVPYQRYRANTDRDENRLIERPKLMLVNSKHTKDDRERLRPRLDHLIETGIIGKHGKNVPDVRDVQDVITDLLIEVFKHTKQQLVENEGFTQDSLISFVLTVPVIWSPKSSRVLQDAVEAAIEATGFGTLGHGSVDNLFIIAEPEAAATFLLGNSHDMLEGETFTVLDCGGGTVDGVTYTVTNGYPLRLKTEVGRPTGDNCGFSYLNDNFQKLLLERLSDETYLDRNGETRASIVRHLVPTFEDYDKRSKLSPLL